MSSARGTGRSEERCDTRQRDARRDVSAAAQEPPYRVYAISIPRQGNAALTLGGQALDDVDRRRHACADGADGRVAVGR
jgi:hypothetical protein